MAEPALAGHQIGPETELARGAEQTVGAGARDFDTICEASFDLAWRTLLERDPEWTDRLRAVARAFRRLPSEFVLLIAAPEHLPRAARGRPLVHGFHVAIGWVADVPREVPSAYLPSMSDALRSGDPDCSHAVIFVPPLTESIRFRVPA